MTNSPWKDLAAALDRLAKSEARSEAKRHKAKKAKKGKQPKKPKKPKPRHWHNLPAGASSGRPSGAAGEPWHAAAPHATGAAPMTVISADHTLATTLLDLAGEGKIGLATALTAWQREQERIANRAWRRPGGLQRMGGL